MTVLQDAAGPAAAGAAQARRLGRRPLRPELRPRGGPSGLRRHARHRVSTALGRGQPRYPGLGLINERVQEDHAVYGIKPDPRHTNLPYPGVFVLDESGVIVGKRFHDSYRERDTGAALLAQTLRILESGPGSTAGAHHGPTQVSAWFDSPTYSFFQRMHLNVLLRTAPGVRICASPAPDGMVPLTVRVSEIPGVEMGPAEWPATQPGRVPGLTSPVPMHTGAMRVLVPLTFAAPPGAGGLTVNVTINYQACSDSARLPPSSVEIRIGIKELAMVDRTLPPPPGS